MATTGRTFAYAVLLESALGLAGVGIAWLAGVRLQESLVVTRPAVLRGLIACVPMLVMLVLLTATNWHPAVRLRQQVERLVRELFFDSPWWELGLISLAAGVGEEVLFRGALQPWIASWTTPAVAVVAVGVLFGLAHAVSGIYFVIATVIGLYFGWLALAYDDLVGPIVAHTMYDFFALAYVQRRVQRR